MVRNTNQGLSYRKGYSVNRLAMTVKFPSILIVALNTLGVSKTKGCFTQNKTCDGR